MTICALICAFLFSGCKNSSAPKAPVSNVVKDTVPVYVAPQIPAMYAAPEQRAEFLSKHYWDNLDFSDTTVVSNSDFIETAWVNYLQILNFIPLPDAQASLKNTFKKADTDRTVLNKFTQMAEHYLYDPNSPYRNEEFYIPTLEVLIESDLLMDMEKIRPKDRLDMANKNRINTKANDFKYTLASGKQSNLHSLKTDYVLIYFNNPGCHTCAEVTESLKNSIQVNYLLSGKRLTILSLYPDEDLQEWKNHLTDLPAEWVNAYDKEQAITLKSLYDLKAIPSLYLLDKNKMVLLKDATFEQVEDYLRQNA